MARKRPATFVQQTRQSFKMMLSFFKQHECVLYSALSILDSCTLTLYVYAPLFRYSPPLSSLLSPLTLLSLLSPLSSHSPLSLQTALELREEGKKWRRSRDAPHSSIGIKAIYEACTEQACL